MVREYSAVQGNPKPRNMQRFYNNMNLSSEEHIAFVNDKDLLDNVVRHDKFCEVLEAASVPSTRKRKAGDSSAPTRVAPRREKKKKISYSS